MERRSPGSRSDGVLPALYRAYGNERAGSRRSGGTERRRVPASELGCSLCIGIDWYWSPRGRGGGAASCPADLAPELAEGRGRTGASGGWVGERLRQVRPTMPRSLRGGMGGRCYLFELIYFSLNNDGSVIPFCSACTFSLLNSIALHICVLQSILCLITLFWKFDCGTTVPHFSNSDNLRKEVVLFR